MSFEPTTFGKYVLLKRIAVGGMAEVFRAVAYGAEGFEKIVAIKRMLPHLSKDQQFVEMFINEAKLAANLNHANVVQIYDFGRLHNALYLSMEYIHGKNIAEIIETLKEQGLSPPIELACYIFIETLNGLEHAHKKKDRFGNSVNLIHRDISPPNILVSYDGEVKLADFGIAKAKESKIRTGSGILKGKYAYMSPEQAGGLDLDFRTDIFSLGICFCELLTLTEMFTGYSDLDTLRHVREANFVAPRKLNLAIPKKLETLLLMALKREPQERYESAAQWREALEDFMIANGLRFSASWLSDFMQDVFKNEMEQERHQQVAEARKAERLHPEATSVAKLQLDQDTKTVERPAEYEDWDDSAVTAPVDPTDDFDEKTQRVPLSSLSQAVPAPFDDEDDEDVPTQIVSKYPEEFEEDTVKKRTPAPRGVVSDQPLFDTEPLPPPINEPDTEFPAVGLPLPDDTKTIPEREPILAARANGNYETERKGEDLLAQAAAKSMEYESLLEPDPESESAPILPDNFQDFKEDTNPGQKKSFPYGFLIITLLAAFIIIALFVLLSDDEPTAQAQADAGSGGLAKGDPDAGLAIVGPVDGGQPVERAADLDSPPGDQPTEPEQADGGLLDGTAEPDSTDGADGDALNGDQTDGADGKKAVKPKTKKKKRKKKYIKRKRRKRRKKVYTKKKRKRRTKKTKRRRTRKKSPTKSR